MNGSKILTFKYLYTTSKVVNPLTMQKLRKWHTDSIALVDDDEDDGLIFKEVIHEIAPFINLQVISDSRELIPSLEIMSANLLFLDLDMPYRSGLQCIKDIRGNHQLNNLPIIICSSTLRPATIQTAYDIGANLYLIKPPFFKAYKSAVAQILELDWTEAEKIKAHQFINNQYFAFTDYTLSEVHIKSVKLVFPDIGMLFRFIASHRLTKSSVTYFPYPTLMDELSEDQIVSACTQFKAQVETME